LQVGQLKFAAAPLPMTDARAFCNYPFSRWVSEPTSILAQKFRQLGKIGCDAPRFITGEQVRRRSASWLIFVVHIRERLAAAILHDEAGAVVLVAPGGEKWRGGVTSI
jgi:hypothetical protein